MPRSWDRAREFPLEVFRKLGELGIMGMFTSDEYGGAELDTVSTVLAIEELSRADAGVGVTVSVQGLASRIIETFASEELKRTYLPAMCAGNVVRRIRAHRSRVRFGRVEFAHASGKARRRICAQRDQAMGHKRRLRYSARSCSAHGPRRAQGTLRVSCGQEDAWA